MCAKKTHANMGYNRMWTQHTLEMRVLKSCIQLPYLFLIVLVDETTRVGGNLVIITGKPSWALLLSLEPQPAVFTVKRKGGQSGGWAATEQLSFYVSYFALLP